MERPDPGRWRGTRRGPKLVAAVLPVPLVAALALGVYAIRFSPQPPPSARLVGVAAGGVGLRDPVVLGFSTDVDEGRLAVTVEPAVEVGLERHPDRLALRPAGRWAAGQAYAVRLGGLRRADGRSGTASQVVRFSTVPRLAAEFTVGGRPAADSAGLGAASRLGLSFPGPMGTGTVRLTRDGATVPDGALSWAPDRTSATLSLDRLLPYQVTVLAMAPGARLASGRPLTDLPQIRLTPLATLPANTSSGVTAGFAPQTPILVAIDNAGGAQPQSGLQPADMVFEYVTEYAITRMTAVYFRDLPSPIGPVRSCRLINAYLAYAFGAVNMCSGVSGGTHVWFAGDAPDARPVPSVMEPSDGGADFFRSAARLIPHNLYTSSAIAERVRAELPQPGAQFAVDPPHPDRLLGDLAPDPAVPQHGATYVYDGGSQEYLRFNGGAPLADADTGAQIHVKNVILMDVGYHDAGYVEDENGGAHSIWYHMLGSGPAEVYSDGRMVPATWHMGVPGQYYYWQNHTPVWFSDRAGRVLELNTGLTWVHVIGNGQ